MKNRDDLIEQYDDAVFALLMDEYAEDSGAELLARFQEEADQGRIPEISEEADIRCLDLIDDEFRARRRHAWVKRLLRGLIRLVFAIFFLLGLLIRTAWEYWQERRAYQEQIVPEAETDEDEPPIFLTP